MRTLLPSTTRTINNLHFPPSHELQAALLIICIFHLRQRVRCILPGNHEEYTGQAREWGEFLTERGFTVLNVRLLWLGLMKSVRHPCHERQS